MSQILDSLNRAVRISGGGQVVDLAENTSGFVRRELDTQELRRIEQASYDENVLLQTVRLVAIGGDGVVEFDIRPELGERKSVNYMEISDIRQAGSISIFMGSPSRTFSISAKFVSRTREEANETFRRVHLLKGWTKPDPNFEFGDSGSNVPQVLKLFAYGNNLKGIPVVIKSYSIDYPTDIAYINSDFGDIPIIQSISLDLGEVRTSDELLGNNSQGISSSFDIEKYKTGTLPNW